MTTVSKLLAGVALASISVFAPAAYAQIAEPQGADDIEDADTSSADGIVVTGSRIARTGADNPTPTTIVDAATIARSGVTEIADLVNEIPSLYVTQNNQSSNRNGFPGLNALDLRGLGTQRTLVLVNSRRRVPAWPGTSAVDVSAIPAGLVERVEVVTGGASALYGADAVAGVVNFILKKDFEGFQANLQSGVSTRGDLRNYNADVLYGTQFGGGRGNVTLYASYNNSPDEVFGQDRPWTAMGTPLYRRPTAGASNWILTDNNRNVYNHNEAVVQLGGAGNLYTFNPDGTLRVAARPSDIINLGNGGNDLSTYLTNSREFLGRFDDYLLQVPSERISAFATANYELTDNIRFFVEGQYSRTNSHSAGLAAALYGVAGDVVPATSPFITAEIRAANGGTIPAGGLLFTRRFPELGRSETDYRRSTVQAVAGFEGEIPNLFGKPWSWTLSYSYGQTRQRYQITNAVSMTRLRSAINSGGTLANPICNSAAARAEGCVAINPFIALTDQAAIDYVTYDTSPARQKLQQHVVSGYLTGGLFDLPAGTVEAVIGGEYRSERNNNGVIPEYDPADPRYDAAFGTTATPLSGKFDVKEVFAELRVPLLKDRLFFDSLTLEGAVRLSDYSTAGSTKSWKVGGEWAPIPDLRFRSTYGQAVRAPNITEVFQAASITSNWHTDPCNYYDIVNRADRSATTVANCNALNPANRNTTYWQWIPVTTQGNPGLDVETARTLTIGAVLRPRFIPGLTLSADYFDIRLKGAISSYAAQTLINRCVDAPTLDNVFCSYVQREAGTNNLIGVTTTRINLSEYRTRGIDFELDYRTSLLGGALSVNAAYTRLIADISTSDPTNPLTKIDYVGVYGSPKWKGAIRATYSNGPYTLNWTMRHLTGMRSGVNINSAQYDKVNTPDIFYHDAQLSVDVAENFSFYGGARNLFDTAPPRFPGAESGGANFENGTQSVIYDVIGRTFYIGARVKY